jgi:small subunit ribosomal protein S24e
MKEHTSETATAWKKDTMEIKITRQQYNPLLKRKEITFKVEDIQTTGTYSRLEVRKTLAAMLKTSIEAVYVKRVETKTGTMTVTGEANIYDVAEQAKIIEPQYIITRNTPKEERKEKTEEKPEKTEASTEKAAQSPTKEE